MQSTKQSSLKVLFGLEVAKDSPLAKAHTEQKIKQVIQNTPLSELKITKSAFNFQTSKGSLEYPALVEIKSLWNISKPLQEIIANEGETQIEFQEEKIKGPQVKKSSYIVCFSDGKVNYRGIITAKYKALQAGVRQGNKYIIPPKNPDFSYFMGYYIFDADDTLQLIYANHKGNKISAKTEEFKHSKVPPSRAPKFVMYGHEEMTYKKPTQEKMQKKKKKKKLFKNLTAKDYIFLKKIEILNL